MPRLLLDSEILVLSGDEDDPIFDWEHQMFFTLAAEYELDEIRKLYYFSDKNRLNSILTETVDNLTEEEIEFEIDAAVAKILSQINAQQEEYESVALLSDLNFQEADQKSLHTSGLVRVLKPYQQSALGHLLAVRHGANFSVPGSGKTTVIYAAFDSLRGEGIVEKLLVIGPRSSFMPWEEESRACFGSPLVSSRLSGAKTTRQSIYLQSAKYDLFLCTYQTASNDLDDIINLCKQHRMFVVIDESHNIKKLREGVWSEAALLISPYAARRAILSGTPVPNDYRDLWTQITFLWPGEQVLGDRLSYGYRCQDESGMTKIRQSVRPFIYRTTKSQLGLPEQKFHTHECDLSPYQASIYRALSIKFLQELKLRPDEQIIVRQWRKAKMIRLIQTASNPALLARYSEEFDIPPLSGEDASVIQLIDKYPQYETPSKISLLLGLIGDLLSRGEKVIIWTSFIHNIKMLQSMLQNAEVFLVYGEIPRDKSEDTDFNREQQIRNFKTAEGPVVLLANPAACAESISLHKVCHHAIYLERTFNCGQYLQSLDRIHRIGLESDEFVTYHILKARNTIDETIDRRLHEKEKRMLQLLEDDLPLGSYEVEGHEMEPLENEETIDFEETIKDIKIQYGTAVE